jgi:hypothetical protein
MQPPTYRIAQPPNAKNPINHSVVLALGESNNGRLNQSKVRQLSGKTTQESMGFSIDSSPDATQTQLL